MQVLNKNTKVIGFAAGIAAAAAGIYLLVKKALNETQISMSKALTQDEKSAIVSQIEVHFDGNNISLETISQIVEASIAFMAADFDQLTWENREARRANTGDLEKYIKYCLDFSEGLKSIIVNSQRDIASGLGIREELWETSHSYHIQKQDGSLLIMQRRVPSRLRMNMKSHKSLSKDEFYNVLKQHISLLETESHIIEKIQSLVVQNNYNANPYSAIGIFQNIVNDMIAEEFGVEEEDFLNAITLYKDDNEARILLDQFQNAVRGLTSKTTKAAY